MTDDDDDDDDDATACGGSDVSTGSPPQRKISEPCSAGPLLPAHTSHTTHDT
jgi:hypothetical protein